MKKMREVNFILYISVTYILSSLYGILFRLEMPKILKFENLNNLSVLFLILLITGYLVTNFFKSLKEVFKSGAKKLCYILVIIYGININNIPLIYAVSICLILVYVVLFFQIRQIKKKEKTKKSENKKEPELYPSRRNLMEVLNHALGEYSLIALDGTWGSGKSTFMDIFMRDNSDKFHYIPVNVMLFENRNSLKTEFLNQLKGVFKEEGIFQGSLMDFDYYLDGVSNDWVKIVKNIIFSKSKSFKEANEKLKSEIGKIEKKIVVGVDNLERIYGESEPEWKQILGFIHELQELGIKIVVMANLEEMLTTKKETGEKDLSNHEYFDKFYEFKLQLNEVTTEEIIDKIEIKENAVDREWLKEQILELTDNLEKYAEMFHDINQGLPKNAPKEITEENYFSIKYPGIVTETIKEEKLELLKRYHVNIKNPRKIEKLIKDIGTKQKNIDNIFKSFIGEDEHKKLIFKASMFSLFYFDFMDEIKRKDFSDFYRENSFFEYFFTNIGESHRGLNRLLHYDSKENLVIDEIKKLISTKEIKLFTIEKRLKDLEVYSSSLDPDFNQETTKEAYKIIEEKLTELENSNKEKIHKIIKENEEFICKMNYLCNPDSYEFYEKISYKFETWKISVQYRELINKFNREYSKYNNLNEDIYMMISKYYIPIPNKRYANKVTEKDITRLIDLIDEEKHPQIITELKNKNLNLFFSEKAERIKLKRIINILNILKVELNKQEVKNKKEVLIVTLEEWNRRDKLKILLELKNYYFSFEFEYKERKVKGLKEVRKILEKIIEEEKSNKYILELEDLIKRIKQWELPLEIIEMVSKIQMEQNLNIKEKETDKLIDFINEKTNDKRYQYIYNGDWDLWESKVKEMGIEVDLENKEVFFKAGK